MEDVLAEVSKAYGLGELLEVETLAVGSMNHSWRVVTQRGRYVVKEVLDVDLERTRRQQEFVRALVDKGFPAPRPLEPLVVRPDGVFEATPFVDGIHISGTELDLAGCRHLGRLLGRLHAELASIRPVGEAHPPRTRHDPEASIATIDAYRKRIAHKADHDEFDRYAAEQLVVQRRLIERWGHARTVDGARGPIGWIHGDFTHSNVLWRDGEIVAVIDWDRLRAWPLAGEPVRCAMFAFPYDLERIAAFMQGYRSRIELDDEAIADAVLDRWYGTLTGIWPLNTHYDTGETRCDRFYYGATERMVWWCENYDEILEAFSSRPLPR